ncbi:hypothetical protein SUGI_0617450 [Cryptomeria japonica]|nr:hypothetical protein SUGI_0617450 [Cryptomeria japonica]
MAFQVLRGGVGNAVGNVVLAPVSELLSRLLVQVAETALAAKDVLIEKESFSELAKYLEKFRPILKELRDKNTRDTPPIRVSVESLERELKLAKELISTCSSKSRFYLLINCRTFVKQIQDITNEIGRCLSLIPIATLDISMDIREKTIALQKAMVNAQFKAAVKEEEIIDKINSGVKEHRIDSDYANEMLLLIARAVGVPVDPVSLKQELDEFKKEKEEAQLRKSQAEAMELQQIIAFLSQADAAQPANEKGSNYQREKHNGRNQALPPLQSFFCPITQEIMEDPVGLISGQTFERSAIEDWFSSGNRTCPVTKTQISTLDLKPNISLQNSIREWKDRNTLFNIAAIATKLRSGSDDEIATALLDLYNLSEEKPVHRDWISAEGLVPVLAQLLNSDKRDIRKRTFATMRSIAINNNENKERIADAGAVTCAVRSLARDIEEGKQAVALLLELSRNSKICQQIGRVQGCILLLVTMLNSEDPCAVQDAGELLNILSNDNQNVVQMAEANYFKPLLQCLSEGSDMTKILMASALARMELTDQSKAALGHEGAISPLVKMYMSGKLEAKFAALRALQNLSTLSQNTEYMINAGIIPPLLQLLFSVTSVLVSLKEPAAAILANLAVANSGHEWKCDLSDGVLENDDIICQLLSLLNLVGPVIQGHLLQALNGMACPQMASQVRFKMRESGAIQLLLPFFHAKDKELRISALELLYSLSQDGSGRELADQLGKTYIVALVKLLLVSLREDEKAAVLGIISNFPVNDSIITEILLQANALQVIVSLLHINNTETAVRSAQNHLVENAAGALIRFTIPSDKRLQHLTVEHDAIPLLVQLLLCGPPIAKSRASTSLAQLSQNSLSLTTPVSKKRSWFCISPSSELICEVHGGCCSVKTSFCLVEAGALVPLLQVLDDKDRQADEAALDALSTLLCDEIWEKGVNAIAGAHGIRPILRLLTVGSAAAQEKAVWILERIFRNESYRLEYGNQAQMPLIDLAQKGTPATRSLAAKILAYFQLLQSFNL